MVAALDQWPREGVPRNPRSWLVSTGRFKAIDKLRRKARFARSQNELAAADRGGRGTHWTRNRRALPMTGCG